MIKKTAFAAATALLATVAMANTIDPGVYPLKDGSTLHVFENGKMGMENSFGYAVFMDQGATMETLDGHKVTMQGNEVARVSQRVRPAEN
jgi:hypothetical protein